MARQVSQAEMFRQIKREGAKWKLFPKMHLGDCMVAEVEAQVVDHPLLCVLTKRLKPFRSVSMDSPLCLVWRSRKRRHQWRLARLAIEADDRRAEMAKKAHEDRQAYRRKNLERAQRQAGTQLFTEAAIEVMRGIFSR